MSKREKVYLRVVPGALQPADNYAATTLRNRGFHVGDILKADITKLNNPKFNRLLHFIGQLCAANLDEFTGMDAHRVLKRLQLEGGIACEEIGIKVPGFGMVTQRIPRSLAFESMDDGERHEVARAMCRHLSENYWPSASPEAIEAMAESMVQEAA